MLEVGSKIQLSANMKVNCNLTFFTIIIEEEKSKLTCVFSVVVKLLTVYIVGCLLIFLIFTKCEKSTLKLDIY